jgi:glycosyltransferase involved in cell wall biosynthesis
MYEMKYPLDLSSLLALSSDCLDDAGVLRRCPSEMQVGVYHPAVIAQYALAHWNAYLACASSEHEEAFLIQANWLLAQQVQLANGIGAWPVLIPRPAYYAFRPWLSASVQGCVLSVLVRAYLLTDDETFLQAACRAVRPFELDILDGGVSSEVGEDGIFFEDVAVYPAAHMLQGFMLAVIGLDDYLAITGESRIKDLIQRGIETLHSLLALFDTGYWTRSDLLHKRLASPGEHATHVIVLEWLAKYCGCEHCVMLAVRWAQYQHNHFNRLRFLVASRLTGFVSSLAHRLRQLVFRNLDVRDSALLHRVCIPIPAFPVSGGMRSVLAGVTQVVEEQWQMLYLTNYKGDNPTGLDIEVFGNRFTTPWQFPAVWLYFLVGYCKLFNLLRMRQAYWMILPQDGVFTGAFAALMGKMAGVRVMCMDHGNVTWLENPAFRRERMQILKSYSEPGRLLARLCFIFYWASLRLLARIATHYTDQFLVAGDEVEEVYQKKLGIHPSSITRYAYMVDVERYTPPSQEVRERMRASRELTGEDIVITLINRLAPEKGLDVAVQGIALALSQLPAEIQQRVKVLIAGEGPLRSQVEIDIQKYKLNGICTLTGEAKPTEVISLLAISDIFLYSGTRGTNYSMAVLEAMAAGCAVIASTSPRSNAKLLAGGRGVAIAPGEVTSIATALVRLCSDRELCSQMGRLAREYVTHFHSAEMLRRSLLRATYFSPSLVMEHGNKREEKD